MAKLQSPRERYQADLTRDDFSYDAAQEQAVELLQQLYERLLEVETAAKPKGLKAKLLASLGKQAAVETVKGLYFWGGVGRGKTYLMDAFYDALPFERKMRVHFHRFMRRVHADLKALQGAKNPLQQVARGIADEARVICFDEFFVSDITDAMILGGLFELLFDYGVCLVATSNIIPDGLYKDGLQRSRFLPAIAMLNKHTQVVNIDSGVDYRLRTLEQAELYHYPLDAGADISLQRSFDQLNPDVRHVRSDYDLEINGRKIQVRKVSDDVAWFDFDALCDGPRSQNDYIELAREFHAVLISGVPQLGGGKDDQARRFINLIDEFYDRHVKLVIAAQVPLAQLYAGGRLDFEFERTQSRLLEMQSHDYLALEHRP
ncbi:cell division protein ZapE [Dasania sp. GY-MA-18]|uniref:Cell division protein ZapE n=1 Tax=Dasania phycosphaerae TaxID=2950436 RepID=A0A9J6RPB1_9GAMM|nr:MULTISPECIES: cell division protein ZapE [Dasania]MCR8923711.1 cell division protein ZapE [Dasania sp. GY-MA-18]MCZ0866145.1 cell division protein ZapE [Dasania phycosphaerae]MCZ0869869.1 cell division protein ZapE [Dasania phycosphaerae]